MLNLFAAEEQQNSGKRVHLFLTVIVNELEEQPLESVTVTINTPLGRPLKVREVSFIRPVVWLFCGLAGSVRE